MHLKDSTGAPVGKDVAEEALKLALDVRKFEIELYWKRATYFWAFTGASFVGYLAVLTAKEVEDRPDALLLVSCLGLLFSVAWYFVNRASKFWQENWEAHVDLLEDAVNGPIYKTVLKDPKRFWQLTASYPFSVTKLNQLLSLYVALMFAGLVANTLFSHYSLSPAGWRVFPTACVLLTLLALVGLYVFGQTRGLQRTVEFNRRTTILQE